MGDNAQLLAMAQRRGVEVNVALEDAPWHEMNKKFKVILGSHNWLVLNIPPLYGILYMI